MTTARNVFVVLHENLAGDVKLVGVYPDRKAAVDAVHRALGSPGFRDEPEGFSIDPYEIGKDHWTGGFTANPAAGPDPGP